MGTSTDAILFYGYCWTEETQEPWHIGKSYEDLETHGRDRVDWETKYAAAHGCLAPVEEYPREANHGSRAEEIKQKYREYWDQKQKLVEACPVEVGQHCMSDCSMPYVAVKLTVKKSYRGDATVIDPASLIPDSSWQKWLDDFCLLMGIPRQDEGPRWFLVSWWG